MDRFFDSENPVMKFLSRLVDLAVLNILTVFTSALIITAGGAITAMNHVLLHLVRKDETYVTRMFWSSFKTNFRQGIPEGLLVVTMLFFVILVGWQERGSLAMTVTAVMVVFSTILYLSGALNPISVAIKKSRKKLKKDYPQVPSFESWCRENGYIDDDRKERELDGE